MGRSSDHVLFIDLADNRLTSLGKQQAGRRSGGRGGQMRDKGGRVQQNSPVANRIELSERGGRFRLVTERGDKQDNAERHPSLLRHTCT